MTFKFEIFKTYRDFIDRKDKDINGVSEDFYRLHPNYLETIVNCNNLQGCWNVKNLTNCSDLLDCKFVGELSNCSNLQSLFSCYSFDYVNNVFNLSFCNQFKDVFEVKNIYSISFLNEVSGFYNSAFSLDKEFVIPKIKDHYHHFINLSNNLKPNSDTHVSRVLFGNLYLELLDLVNLTTTYFVLRALYFDNFKIILPHEFELMPKDQILEFLLEAIAKVNPDIKQLRLLP